MSTIKLQQINLSKETNQNLPDSVISASFHFMDGSLGVNPFTGLPASIMTVDPSTLQSGWNIANVRSMNLALDFGADTNVNLYKAGDLWVSIPSTGFVAAIPGMAIVNPDILLGKPNTIADNFFLRTYGIPVLMNQSSLIYFYKSNDNPVNSPGPIATGAAYMSLSTRQLPAFAIS